MTNEAKRKFETMLPLDVSKKLLKLARETSETGRGHFDYGVALRILFERAERNEDIQKILGKLYIIESELKKDKGGFK